MPYIIWPTIGLCRVPDRVLFGQVYPNAASCSPHFWSPAGYVNDLIYVFIHATPDVDNCYMRKKHLQLETAIHRSSNWVNLKHHVHQIGKIFCATVQTRLNQNVSLMEIRQNKFRSGDITSVVSHSLLIISYTSIQFPLDHWPADFGYGIKWPSDTNFTFSSSLFYCCACGKRKKK